MLQLVPALDRLGTETAFEVLARADALKRQGKDIINLGIGQPDFKTPAHIVEAAIKALRDGHHGYTPAQGILPLREAVAADMKRRHGVEVHPDTIVILPGGKPTMFFSILMFGQPGAEIMYPDPGFPDLSLDDPVHRRQAGADRAERGQPVRFTADEVLAQITPQDQPDHSQQPRQSHRRRVPQGGDRQAGGGPGAPPARRGHVGRDLQPDAVRRPQARVLPALSRDPRPADPARRLVQDLRHDRLAARLLRLAESAGGEGVRLGVNSHSCVNAPTQYAGIAALEGPQDEVHQMVAAFDERRRTIVPLLNQLPGFSCLDPGGAFYVFPNVTGTGMDARKLQNKMLEKAGVATVAGTSFGIHGEGYIRFSYANSVENIREAIERIAALLRD